MAKGGEDDFHPKSISALLSVILTIKQTKKTTPKNQTNPKTQTNKIPQTQTKPKTLLPKKNLTGLDQILKGPKPYPAREHQSECF